MQSTKEVTTALRALRVLRGSEISFLSTDPNQLLHRAMIQLAFVVAGRVD